MITRLPGRFIANVVGAFSDIPLLWVLLALAVVAIDFALNR